MDRTDEVSSQIELTKSAQKIETDEGSSKHCFEVADGKPHLRQSESEVV
ncbi:hypothetical protein [Streptococcus pneumoniae]|nr:hypothetical protein [Streptococcus pneumoniae]